MDHSVVAFHQRGDYDPRELSPLVNYTRGDYEPSPYDVPATISQTHNQPRFGRSNRFDSLIDGSQEERQEYIVGIIIGAMIVLSVAIVWFLAIMVLKALGHGKVGFFAGRLVRPGESSKGAEEGNEGKGGVEVVMEGNQPAENDVDEAVPVTGTVNADQEKKFTRTVWAVRAIFVLSGILVIISGGLFYGKGVVSFKNSIDEVRSGINLVQNAALKTIAFSKDVVKAEDDVEQEIEEAREAAKKDGQICGLDIEISSQIRTAYDELSKNIVDLKNMLDTSLQSFSHDMESLIVLTDQVDSSLDSADIFFYVLITISIVLIGIILCMLAGVFFAWKGVSNGFTKCIQYAIIWPLFVFFLVLSWIFATLFLTFSLAGADFCIDPDGHVQALLNKNADMFEGIIFGFIIFYVSGCTITPTGAVEIKAIADQAKVVIFHAHRLTELLGDVPAESIVNICGLNLSEADALKTLINFLHDSTHFLNRAIVGLRGILACETFNPIYTTFVHSALCVQGVSGLTYIFSTTIVISIFSMIMIMFRAALYPIKEPAAQPATKSEGAMEVVEYKKSPGDENVGDEKPVIY